jgi:pimeloyl-ACP methyl ester carboxylesterase
VRKLQPSERLPYIRGALLSVPEAFRQAVEDLVLALGGNQSRDRHLIAFVHGIRTRAVWFEPLAAVLERIPNVSTRSLSYGYLDLLRFLVPGLRRGTIRHLKDQLALLARENEDARVSVIAHSFGTYVVSRLLDQEPSIRLNRVVFCGSVVPPRYNWHRIAGKIDNKPVVNECGTRDPWPVLATLTLGYGASGTFGFQHTEVLNRFHDLAHSGFFRSEFYEIHWVPLWLQPDAPPKSLAYRPPSPGWLNLLGIFPLRWILAIAIALIIGFLSLRRG